MVLLGILSILGLILYAIWKNGQKKYVANGEFKKKPPNVVRITPAPVEYLVKIDNHVFANIPVMFKLIGRGGALLEGGMSRSNTYSTDNHGIATALILPVANSTDKLEVEFLGIIDPDKPDFETSVT